MNLTFPPPPSLGVTTPIGLAGRRIGSVVQIAHGRHVTVCAHPDCHRENRARLCERPAHHLAARALRRHWQTDHQGARP